MEYILMALFGGGILDWQDISKTEYEWEDIFQEIKFNYNSLDEVDMNTLYFTILEMAQRDFCEMIEDFINEYGEDKNYSKEVEILKNFDFENWENWEIFCNYLDTHISLFTTKEVVEALEVADLDSKIQDINDKIGFTYINIEDR